MHEIYVDMEERHARERAQALAMGGPEKLEKRRRDHVLNARERIERLVDDETWEESGLFANSADPVKRTQLAADGKIVGFGKVEGRETGVIAYDFTVKGSSSSPISEEKSGHIKDVCRRRGIPLVFLGESTGVRMPDVLGGVGMGRAKRRNTRFLRQREAPWASAILGHAFGSAAWHACASDFNVIRKGATMAVSSQRLVEMATKEKVNADDLGGWRVHAEDTGFADYVVDNDEEAIDAIRRFLSYMPGHCMQAPPVVEVPDRSNGVDDAILEVVPEVSNQVYDVREVIAAIMDPASVFELKAKFGKSLTTALARLDGSTVGVIANNPKYKGGSIDAAACDKATSMIVLCDSFNIPIIFLVDQPGFLIGKGLERQGMIGKVINWMNALSLCTVPKISLILRKSYGQAFINMGGGGTADEVAAWWTAEISFMDPAAAVDIVYGIRKEEDPSGFEKAIHEMRKSTSAYDFASVYGAQNVIDPRESRHYLKRVLDIHRSRLHNGVGEHLLNAWPTSFR